jgi:hypothetical protein
MFVSCDRDRPGQWAPEARAVGQGHTQRPTVECATGLVSARVARTGLRSRQWERVAGRERNLADADETT